VVDFPLFEYSKTEKKLVSVHHPFTKPYEEDLKLLESAPDKIRSHAYDMVLNGYEVGGGSIRIHDPKLQARMFEILGISKTEAERRFGHLLAAFQYGVPPHGGIAPGLDRLVMIYANEPNIREVMAFPKTGDAREPLTGAPTQLPEKTLIEANIKIRGEQGSEKN
jgi:aspartyl-tRNA synthetase